MSHPQITSPEEIHRLLDRRILAYVERPARYTGGEINSVCKDAAGVEVRFALLFPDAYEVGMSHLGYQILYSILNGLDWVAAERAYAPWPDMQQRMVGHGVPLYALESRQPVRDFDVVGFSLQSELLCTNVLQMLHLANIPVESAERGPDDPIVIAGGCGAAAPEPMADFIDLFFVGDGEEAVVEFAALLRRTKAEGAARRDIILEAARAMQGVYAPAFYRVEYDPDGTGCSIRPSEPGLPERVRAAKVADLSDAEFPTRPIVPFIEAVHDRITLEIMRGCTRGCRFCQVGMLRRPVRPRSIEKLLEQAAETYRNTGHAEIALASLSSSDYPDIQALMERMNAFAEPRGVNLSLSSLRADDQLRLLPKLLARVRKSGLTIAPEAGSDRLRRVINKDITNEALIRGAEAAFAAGWRHLKLYFMIGLPTETPDDLTAIVELSEQVSAARRPVDGAPGRVNVSITPFIPKPHTPFQWEAMAPLQDIRAARKFIRAKARRRNVKYTFHPAESSLLEAALARGDRRVGRAVKRAWQAGQQFDAWIEHFSFERWREAFAAEGLSMESYACRERSADEALPWDHIDFGLSRDFLLSEREKARRAEFTPDCRLAGCTDCGVCPGRDGRVP